MSDVTFDLLNIVVSIAATMITLYLIPFLRSQTSVKEMDELVNMINVAVKAAEQTLDGGKTKKAEVIMFISNWMKKRGIAITDEQLDKLIESAVYSMNNTAPEVVVNTVTEPVNSDK